MIRLKTPLDAALPTPVRLGFLAHWQMALSIPLIWGIWAVTRGIMLLNLIVGQHYSDPQFYQYAGDFAMGRLPYVNIPVEYPPVAMLLILLPAIPLLPFAAIAPRPEIDAHPVTADPTRYGAYGTSFAIMMIIIDALTLMLVMRVARRWTPGDPLGRWSGLLYVLLIFASGTLLQKFDLTTGALCLLAVLLMLERRDGWAWALLALGTMIKGYPIFLAPLFLIWRMPDLRPDWAALRRALIGGTTACVTTVGPVLLAAGIGPLIHSVLYHADRGTEIESTWGSLMLATAWIPQLQTISLYNPADLSRDITSTIDAPLARLATPLLLAGCLGIYFLFWRRLRTPPGRALSRAIFVQTGNVAPATSLMQAATAIILLFALSFRALPAHYLLGVLPLAAVMRLPGRPQWIWLGLLVGGLILGQLVVTYWTGLIAFQPGPMLLMIGRNCLLIAACIALVRAPTLPRLSRAERS